MRRGYAQACQPQQPPMRCKQPMMCLCSRLHRHAWARGCCGRCLQSLSLLPIWVEGNGMSRLAEPETWGCGMGPSAQLSRQAEQVSHCSARSQCWAGASVACTSRQVERLEPKKGWGGGTFRQGTRGAARTFAAGVLTPFASEAITAGRGEGREASTGTPREGGRPGRGGGLAMPLFHAGGRPGLRPWLRGSCRHRGLHCPRCEPWPSAACETTGTPGRRGRQR